MTTLRPLTLCLLLVVLLASSSPTHAEVNFSGYIDMKSHTILQVLLNVSGDNPPSFDNNHEDYDILLRLISDVDMHSVLSTTYNAGVSIFAIQDIGLMQTAKDITHIFNLKRSVATEQQAYDIIKNDFIARYRDRTTILTLILRYHIVPARISMQEIFGGGAFNTLANQKIGRSGVSFKPADPRFPNADYSFLQSTVETSNGNLHVIDRMLVPSLHGYAAAPRQNPSPTSTPTPSSSPSIPAAAAGAKPSSKPPSASISPSPSLSSSPRPSSSPNPAESITPLPTYSRAVLPMTSQSPNPSSPPPPVPNSMPQQTAQSPTPGARDGASESKDGGSCFPGVSMLSTPHGPMRMDAIQPGMLVHTSKGWEPVMTFSHAQRGTFEFVELRTNGSMTLTASEGHFVIRGDGTLTAAGEVRVGDVLRVADGTRTVQKVQRVMREGLFAPHTASGQVVVDGFVVSCYTTAVKVAAAHAWLAPVRAAVALGVVDPLQGSLSNGADGLLTAWWRLSRLVRTLRIVC